MTTPLRPETLRRRAAALDTGGLAVLLAGGGAAADAWCRGFSGRYTEHLAPDGCTSPVGFCIDADHTGGPRSGTFAGIATSFVATADSPMTGVSLFTTDTIAGVRASGTFDPVRGVGRSDVEGRIFLA